MPATYSYPRPAVTVDAIVFHKVEKTLEVLLIQRRKEPFAGLWAFPGGFVDENEDPAAAVTRELAEETGIAPPTWQQLGFWGQPGRDPRGHTISLVYWGLLANSNTIPTAADDASDARWFQIDHLPPLAFDHENIFDFAICSLEKIGENTERP